jgi:DNA-3-methyladenine glycosylase II
MTQVHLAPAGPFDLALSLQAANRFTPRRSENDSMLRSAVRIHDAPMVLALQQVRRDPPILKALTSCSVSGKEMKRIAGRMVFAELNLRAFYRHVATHPVLGPITKTLRGLHPMRPATLFEMLVIAITEQQISLAAAYRIRANFLRRFGDPVEDLWAFPTPRRIARTSVPSLMTCGLSRKKALYIRKLAQRVDRGLLDLTHLETLPDEEVRSLLLQQRGLGPWSAEYALVRGLGRPNRVPLEDLGIRSVVGQYLGRGQRLSPLGASRKLHPFAPYRGLVAFYLLAYDRLLRSEKVARARPKRQNGREANSSRRTALSKTETKLEQEPGTGNRKTG